LEKFIYNNVYFKQLIICENVPLSKVSPQPPQLDPLMHYYYHCYH